MGDDWSSRHCAGGTGALDLAGRGPESEQETHSGDRSTAHATPSSLEAWAPCSTARRLPGAEAAEETVPPSPSFTTHSYTLCPSTLIHLSGQSQPRPPCSSDTPLISNDRSSRFRSRDADVRPQSRPPPASQAWCIHVIVHRMLCYGEHISIWLSVRVRCFAPSFIPP